MSALSLVVFLCCQIICAPVRAAQFHDDAVRSSGCGTATSRAGLFTLEALDGKGDKRSYFVEMPEGYTANQAYVVVFVFHGSGGSAHEGSDGMRDANGASQSALFVYPQGAPVKNFGVGWDDSLTGYDMPFFDHMLTYIGAQFCVDTSRIFAAGFSWGGDFVTALACGRGDKIRAVVANSTNDEFTDKFDFKTYQNYPCPAGKHPAILFQHAVDGDSAYPAPYFATTSQLFKNINACASTGKVLEPHTAQMACVTYNGCSNTYTECFFDHRIGHARPPGWAQDAWAFFSRF